MLPVKSPKVLVLRSPDPTIHLVLHFFITKNHQVKTTLVWVYHTQVDNNELALRKIFS